METQRLVKAYVDQLLNGCLEETCVNRACDTGRRNATRLPVRRYTPRSARAIALVLASEPRPTSRLCKPLPEPPEVVLRPSAPVEQVDEGPHDPADMMQQLCDSKPIKSFMTSHPLVVSTQYLPMLSSLHELLENLDSASQKASRGKPVKDIFLLSNKNMAATIFTFILYLAERTSELYRDGWNAAISAQVQSSAVPVVAQESHNTQQWLDSLAHEPNQRLLTRAIDLLAKRTKEEYDADRLCVKLGLREFSKFSGLERSNSLLEHMVIDVWSRKHPVQLFWRIYSLLQRLFQTNWDGKTWLVHGTTACGAVELLEALWYQGNGNRHWNQIFFALPVRHDVDPLELAKTWRNVPENSYHLLSFGILFRLDQRSRAFRTLNHLRMREAHSKAEMASALRRRVTGDVYNTDNLTRRQRHEEQHYLLLNVGRTSVLDDAYSQLWLRRRGELLLPLRVRLGEMEMLEVGHDLGGVQIEFFNLLCREAFSEERHLFVTTDSKSHCNYFAPMSLEPMWRFELLGTLLALGVYNGITLAMNLPVALYERLLADRIRNPFPFDLAWLNRLPRYSLEFIQEAWPTLFRSLSNVMAHEVELEYAFPLEANGLRMSVRPTNMEPTNGRRTLTVYSAIPIDANGSLEEVDIESIADAWPGWHLVRSLEEPEEVTFETKQQYVRDYVRFLTHDSVAPQLEAFEKGFFSIIPAKDITMFHSSPKEFKGRPPASGFVLKAHVEGTTRLDIGALQRATLYEGFNGNGQYINDFWKVVAAWPLDRTKKLVKFVTAVERLPVNMANFRFVIQKTHAGETGALPTSSTCFGTLKLPQYGTVEELDKKLTLAVEYGCEGFGTG